MNDGMAETAIISGEVDLARIKLPLKNVDRRKILTYAAWAVFLAAFALVVEQSSGNAFASSSYFTERTYGAARIRFE